MHYYQHNIGDYLRDTHHLSLLEHGAYRQLLDLYYLNEGNIPEETNEVCRRLHAITDEEKNAVQTVLNEFFEHTGNGWKHARCDREISAYKAKADRARDNGKLGGRPKKTKVVISGNLEETQTKANHKPLTINQELNISSDSKLSPTRFTEFWNAYPSGQRKVAKAACRKKWDAQKLDLIADEIIADVRAKADSRQWKDGFWPAPLTYLNQRRWEDGDPTPTHETPEEFARRMTV